MCQLLAKLHASQVAAGTGAPFEGARHVLIAQVILVPFIAILLSLPANPLPVDSFQEPSGKQD